MNWTQLQAILWLRWRLTKNQWTRAGQLNAVLTLLATVAGLLVALAGCVGGVIAGATLLAKAPAPVHLIVWDIVILAFLFYWAIGVATELQRSESIDLTRLLHLPVSLKEVFILNYLASHLALSIIIFLPGMLGLILGLTLGTGWRMLGLAPLVLGFLFMVTAWTYCLRGWLVSLMVNQRRRRTIVVMVTLAVILGTQLPNLYFNVYMRRSGHRSPSQRHHAPEAARDSNRFLSPAVLAAHRYVPPLWVAKGAMELGNRNPWPALWGTAGFWVIGALGLARAYRATLRFYRGEQGSKGNKHSPAVTAAAVARPTRPLLIEREFPGIPEPAQTLALASFRSLTRAPEVKLVLATNFIFLIVFAFLFFSGKPSVPEEFKPLVVTLALMVPFFALTQLLFNQFGVDRDAFRAFILLPAGRRDILLGKNLAYLPLALGAGALILGILMITLSISPLVLLAGTLQLLAAFMLFCMLGNLASILVPYRVSPGSLKPTKTPLKSMLLISLAHLMFPVVMVPVFLPPGLAWLAAHWGWLPASAVNLPLSLALTGAIAWMYWMSLDGLGSLLSQREQAILTVLTKEVE